MVNVNLIKDINGSTQHKIRYKKEINVGTLKFRINLTKTQKQIHEWVTDKTTRIIVWCASRQCGKSLLSEVLLIEYLFKPRTFNAYISPTYANGRKVYKEICSLLEGKNIITKANSSTLTIETIFKSTLQFFSTESPSSIRGNTIKNGICVIDEAAYMPDVLSNGELPFENVILPILKANWDRNKLLIISTPHGRRGFFYQQYEKAINNEEGYKGLLSNIYTDELISKEQLEMLKSNMPPLAWQQEFECQFLDDAASFFKDFSKCFKEFTYNNNLPQYIGIDLSNVGNDKTILTKINTNNEVEQYEIEGTLDVKYYKIAKLIDETPNLKNVIIEANGAGIVQLNEIRKLSRKSNRIHEFITTNSSKLEQASALSLLFAKEEISIELSNTLLFNELSRFGYKYTKSGKMHLMGESNSHDDRVLSLMLAIQSKHDVKEPMTKSNFSRQPNLFKHIH